MPCRVQEGLSPRQLLLFYTENFSCHVQENSGFEPRGHQSPRIPLHSNSREDSCNVRGLATLPSHSDSPPLSGLVGALNLVSRALWLHQAPVQLLGVHSCWLRGAKGPGWEAQVSRIQSFMLRRARNHRWAVRAWAARPVLQRAGRCWAVPGPRVHL